MRHQKHLTLLLVAGLAVTASVGLGNASIALAVEAPVAVSPGDASKMGVVEARCPTFSWGGVEGAVGYELVVYKLGEETGGEEPVLHRSFSGSVESWTPSLEECPERGARYAWSVRASNRDAASEWSAASLFAVAAGPSEAEVEEAMEVVRQHRRPAATAAVAQGTAPSPGLASALSEAGSASLAPALQSLAVGDSALMVNGSAVVTTATLGALGLARVPRTGQTMCYDAAGAEIDPCTAGIGPGQDGHLQLGVTWPNPRFTKNLDGTVTDNLTGLIWLENADCAAATMNWAAALNFANTLSDGSMAHNGGDCGLSDGSAAGAWRLPNVRELQSLVHFGVFVPAVPNTAGTGKWVEGDPFSGVQLSFYWSSTTVANATVNAWNVPMFIGGVNFDNKTNSLRVWPVRGGQ